MLGVRALAEQSYTLGHVVGRLDGIDRELKHLREELQEQRQAIQALRQANSNWRWLERVGVLLGGALTGFFGGRVAGQ